MQDAEESEIHDTRDLLSKNSKCRCGDSFIIKDGGSCGTTPPLFFLIFHLFHLHVITIFDCLRGVSMVMLTHLNGDLAIINF